MTAAKHTAGPWTVESDGTTVSMDGQCVIVTPAPDGTSHDEAKANARLIAAAPELLGALRDVVASCEKAGVAIVDLSRARAAMRQAGG